MHSTSIDQYLLGSRTSLALPTSSRCSNDFKSRDAASRSSRSSGRKAATEVVFAETAAVVGVERRGVRSRLDRNCRRRKSNFGIPRYKHPKAICICTNSKKHSSQHLGTIRNRACFLDGTNEHSNLIHLEIRNDCFSESLMFAIMLMQMHCVSRHVHFHRTQRVLASGT
jgi:hypothetical protein